MPPPNRLSWGVSEIHQWVLITGPKGEIFYPHTRGTIAIVQAEAISIWVVYIHNFFYPSKFGNSMMEQSINLGVCGLVLS